jgi:pilus assembly protein Flp/PilA
MLKAYLISKTRLLDIRDRFTALKADESGAALIEYAMIVGLVAVAAVTALTTLNSTIGNAFATIGTKLTTAIN